MYSIVFEDNIHIALYQFNISYQILYLFTISLFVFNTFIVVSARVKLEYTIVWVGNYYHIIIINKQMNKQTEKRVKNNIVIEDIYKLKSKQKDR